MNSKLNGRKFQDLIKVLVPELSGGTEENHEEPHSV
jgi:hypothetical protein